MSDLQWRRTKERNALSMQGCRFSKVLKDKIDIKGRFFTVDLFFYVIFKKKCMHYNIIRFFRNSRGHRNAFPVATRMSLSWRIYTSLAHRTRHGKFRKILLVFHLRFSGAIHFSKTLKSWLSWRTFSFKLES